MNEPVQSIQDQRLIAATLAGDQEAFGELVRRYQDRLFNALNHLIGNESEAQDVVQDAFVLAFTKLNTFRGQSGFFTWLFRIARNSSISRYRKEKKTTSIDGNDERGGPLALAGSGPAPDDGLLREETVVRVRLAMARLSEEHRAILILREIEDLDYDQIAEALDLPIGTVRSRLHRARSQLKTEIEALEPVKAEPRQAKT